MAFFIPLTCVTLSQFYSNTSLVLFTKNNKLWNERKEEDLLPASAYHVISEEVENRVFRDIRIFRHTYTYNNPYWPVVELW